MFVGLVILALPITIIGANFDELYREMRKKEHLRKQVSAGGAYVRVIARPRGPTPPNPAWTYGRQTPAHKLRELAAEQAANCPEKSGVRSRLSRGLRANSGDPEAEDVKPLILIQDCMRAANVRLAEGIEVLMAQEEERLRREIKQSQSEPLQLSSCVLSVVPQPTALVQVLDEYIATHGSPLDIKRAPSENLLTRLGTVN
eukprot:scaffold189122_cov30-Tisochrysis_lutea.AAC.1